MKNLDWLSSVGNMMVSYLTTLTEPRLRSGLEAILSTSKNSGKNLLQKFNNSFSFKFLKIQIKELFIKLIGLLKPLSSRRNPSDKISDKGYSPSNSGTLKSTNHTKPAKPWGIAP